MVDVVRSVACTTAEELLDWLSPLHQPWCDEPGAWIFRGHSDSGYELRATAHRPGEIEKLKPPPSTSTQTWVRYEACERWLLTMFKRQLDEASLPIPSLSPDIYPTNHSVVGSLLREGWPLKALAQHHGLPTDLLDWTRAPRNGAYFAAVGAARKSEDAGTSDVWALRVDFMESGDSDWGISLLPHSEGLKLYRAPQSSNPNLFAQRGLFTVVWGSDGRVPTVDEFVSKYVAQGGKAPPGPLLYRISLPKSEAPKLLRLLSYEGINGASMFPGHDGVVRSIKERAWWDRQD